HRRWAGRGGRCHIRNARGDLRRCRWPGDYRTPWRKRLLPGDDHIHNIRIAVGWLGRCRVLDDRVEGEGQVGATFRERWKRLVQLLVETLGWREVREGMRAGQGFIEQHT